jgi:hypothetical protein
MDPVILLYIWVVISCLILALSILNLVSNYSLEKRVDALDDKISTNPLVILLNNWDIVLASLIGFLTLSTLLFDGVRSFVRKNAIFAAGIYSTVILLCVVGVIYRRKKRKN